jgi:uncharacterized protein with GYD domain
MATYVSLLKYTQKGAESIKQVGRRIEGAKQAAKAAGAEIKQIYLVMGRYDVVVISEGPDDESAARLALATSMQGNVQTETLRAFTEAEFLKIVASLP